MRRRAGPIIGFQPLTESAMRRYLFAVLVFCTLSAVRLPAQELKVDKEWIDKISELKPKEQSAAIRDKLQELNLKHPTTVSFKTEDDKITEYTFLGNGVGDISPLIVLKHLTKLNIGGTPPTSETDKVRVDKLDVLKGMPLVELNIAWHKVKDLSPLKGMQLKSINCNNNPVFSLGPLEGMPLESVACVNAEINSLGPLKGAPLKTLDCSGTKVMSFAPLKGAPLTSVTANYTQIADVRPLKEMQLKQFAMYQSL